MKPGIVVFAGAGAGAPDLLTLRCRDAIAEADVIVYAGSLVNPEVLKYARPECRLHDSASMDLPQIVAVLSATARAGRKALRLHTGDPAIYGAIAEQMRALDAEGIAYEVIPGVSSVFACAAALKAELTLPGVSQTIILTRRAGRTPVPAGQDIASLATHGATMAIFLSAGDLEPLTQELMGGGYASDTPTAIVYRASWPDQRIVTGTLADIAAKAAEARIERQAIVLVGGALGGHGEASRLYASDFAHGYREAHPQSLDGGARSVVPAVSAATGADEAAPSMSLPPNTSHPTPNTCFTGTLAVYALTEAGAATAARLATAVGGSLFLSRERAGTVPEFAGDIVRFDGQDLAGTVAAHWRRFDGHVFVMASGIVVRKIAPLLTSKTTDPAVVVCDERGRYAISLIGGHIGGANRLAQRVAAALNGQAVVTTATDVQGVLAFDEWAARQGWRVENPAAIKALNSQLLARKRIGVALPAALVRETYGDREHIVAVDVDALPADLAGLVVVDRPDYSGPEGLPTLRLVRPGVVLGIGCNRGTPADEIEAAVRSTLKDHGIEFHQVRGVASIDLKSDEEGLLAFAGRQGWPLTFLPAAQLDAVSVPNPSSTVAKATGSGSVAEAAALAVAGGALLVPKQKHGAVTVAVAQVKGAATPGQPGRVLAVGIGPGTPEGLTARAKNALLAADVVVGYKPYCEQIAWLTGGKPVLATGMRDEVQRCQSALDEAVSGKVVAVVCSGDSGVYGMAGLLLELVEARKLDLEVEVVPGVTSALEAAAALGAPLMNDYATISLSDLLTPHETVAKRLRAVATSGMTCVLYNPRSHKRHDLLDDAIRLFTEARGGDVPAGIVKHAGRSGQEIWVGPLRELPVQRVDMSTLVVLGNEETCILHGRMVVRRGYEMVGGGRC